MREEAFYPGQGGMRELRQAILGDGLRLPGALKSLFFRYVEALWAFRGL